MSARASSLGMWSLSGVVMSVPMPRCLGTDELGDVVDVPEPRFGPGSCVAEERSDADHADDVAAVRTGTNLIVVDVADVGAHAGGADVREDHIGQA
jgi:hypothetical protein